MQNLKLRYPPNMFRIVLIAFVSATLMSCASITPEHEIRMHPDHIQAGVQKGDTVIVTMNNGKVYTFEVVRVWPNSIEGPFGPILFSEITSITKRSWTTPGHACGGNKPVGCSIPAVVTLLSVEYETQAQKFEPACATHDFCYRHGYATYGDNREDCDATFYDEMKDSCNDGLNIDVLDLGMCKIAAKQTFAAVRKYGEKHFETSGSTFCEWR